eukprot:721787-Prorocentrum_minimum.AAC.9
MDATIHSKYSLMDAPSDQFLLHHILQVASSQAALNLEREAEGSRSLRIALRSLWAPAGTLAGSARDENHESGAQLGLHTDV